ncbi:hypothetical protein CBL_07991 [Carabus blaptoides fortunei]
MNIPQFGSSTPVHQQASSPNVQDFLFVCSSTRGLGKCSVTDILVTEALLTRWPRLALQRHPYHRRQSQADRLGGLLIRDRLQSQAVIKLAADMCHLHDL